MTRHYFILSFCLCYCCTLTAQDLEQLGKAPLLKTSGGVSWSTQFTQTNNDQNQRDPFFWLLQGNLNFKFMGLIDAPFSFSFNNQESTTTQPALPTQFGISPTYKGYTLHAGWRSMNLSKYTLGGQTFLGVGADITPRNYWLSGSFMYGRLQESIQPIAGQNDGVYNRRGYGVKITAGKKDYVSLIAFRARDDEHSIRLDSLDEDVAPQENLVWSIVGKKSFGKKLTFQGEFAQSAFTNDTRNTNRVLDNTNYFNNLGNLITPNATTQFNTAWEASVSYKPKVAKFQFAYKRIAPDYQTLGIQSVNNDLEEYKAGVNWQMFQKKVSIATNVGVQQNNLDKTLAVGVTKIASSFSVNWVASKKLNFNTSYSNFNTQSLARRTPNLTPVSIQLDTLEFFQVTRNVTFVSNYSFGTDTAKHGLSLSSNFQNALDSDGNNNDALNLNLAHTYTFTPAKLSIATSYNYNTTTTNDLNIVSLGPSLAISKPIVKNAVTLTLALTRLGSRQDGEKQSNVTNANFSARYRLKKSHNFTLSALSSHQDNILDASASTSEQRVNFQYAFKF